MTQTTPPWQQWERTLRASIDYLGDTDYFRFTAEEGQLYQIDVDLGSLPDSVLVLLGPDGWELAYNDDYGDSLGVACRLVSPGIGRLLPCGGSQRI